VELRPAPRVAVGKATTVGTNACVRKRRPVARRALVDQEDDAPSSATAYAKNPTTARPWRPGRQERILEAQCKKRGQRPSLTFRDGVRACWGARWREGVMLTQTRA
jgi:hypothetical protein